MSLPIPDLGGIALGSVQIWLCRASAQGKVMNLLLMAASTIHFTSGKRLVDLRQTFDCEAFPWDCPQSSAAPGGSMNRIKVNHHAARHSGSRCCTCLSVACRRWGIAASLTSTHACMHARAHACTHACTQLNAGFGQNVAWDAHHQSCVFRGHWLEPLPN